MNSVSHTLAPKEYYLKYVKNQMRKK